MATLDLHRIKARDGLDLPVWVTTPRGKPERRRAAVVLVHGGPWVRGTHWRWSADAQFLASRGYVVIEPEYRGSTGFGRATSAAGFKKWGTTMQDDVADAVNWAADKGLIDGKRVCIAGASYGGYATLMGAIRFPELYRCGVAWVAVTDPRLMFEPLWRQRLSDARFAQYSLPMPHRRPGQGSGNADRGGSGRARRRDHDSDPDGVRKQRPARADRSRHAHARGDAAPTATSPNTSSIRERATAG